MNQALSAQVLVQVFSLSPSAMLTLADALRGEAMKKIQANDEEKGNSPRAAKERMCHK